MAYDVNKLSRVKHLKDLAQRINEDFATKAALKVVSDKVDQLVTAGGEPNVLEAVKVNGTALPITGKAVDVGASIAAAVSAADHLQRKKVASKDAIDPAAEGADKFIYMVPKTGSDEDDQYDEYMVLGGKVEHVGNTKVDLSGYVQKEDGAGLYPDADKEKLAGIVMAEDTEITAMLDEVFGAAQTTPETPEVTEP